MRQNGDALGPPGPIRAFPNLDSRQAFRRRHPDDPIISRPSMYFYSSARGAIHQAVRWVNPPEGSVFLLPSYHCGVEVEAVLRAGAEVEFYGVHRDLSIDLDDLFRRLTPRTRGVLLVHYFGFPQEIEPILERCRRERILVIEDCAHGLYSQFPDGRWLGSVGDVASFSFQKTVFLPNGGGLLLNRPQAPPPPRGKRHFDLDLAKSLVKSALEHEASSGGALSRVSGALSRSRSPRAPENGGLRTAPGRPPEGRGTPWYYDVPRFGYDVGMSRLSKFFLGRQPWSEIRSRRRRNYEFLCAAVGSVGGFTPLFPDLPEGVCPLGLPVWVERLEDTDRYLRAHRIEPYVFGRQPHPRFATGRFAEADSLSKHVLCLPAHQQLTPGELEFIASTVGKAGAACRATP